MSVTRLTRPEWWAFLGAMRNVGKGDRSETAIRRVVVAARAWISVLDRVEGRPPWIEEMREEAAGVLARYGSSVAPGLKVEL